MSNEPKRIQLKRTKGWRKPEGAVVVSRPSKWGNPYRIEPWLDEEQGWGWKVTDSVVTFETEFFHSRVEAAEYAVELLRDDFDQMANHLSDGAFAASFAPLRGHDLACWCPLNEPCHADVLLKLANAPQPPESDS